MNTLPRLSASKLKLYERCPKQYVYRYLRNNEDKLNVWGIVGTAAHKAIEQHYRTGTDIAQGFLDRTKNMDSTLGGYEDYAYKLLVGTYMSLKEFDPTQYPIYQDASGMHLERYFNLPYPADNPVCTLNGYIDHVTPTGFIDYKTGKDKPSKKNLRDDLQFIIYFWAYEQMYKHKPEYGIYYRLRDNRPIQITEVNTDKLETMVQKFINDPMEYDTVPCEDCPLWCGVKNANH